MNFLVSSSIQSADDETFTATIIEVYRQLYAEHFLEDQMANHRLPTEVRALRRSDGARVCLLLTPWMLTRLFFPEVPPPAFAMPPGWTAEERQDQNAEFTVLGPSLTFTTGSNEHKVHLAYHHRLGHYLMQPLVLAMEDYVNAEAVFAAWHHVIQIRDEAMKKLGQDGVREEEVSRRDFFSRFRNR